MRRRLASSGWRPSSGYFSICSCTNIATIDIARLIEMYTVEPARLLKIDAGTLSIGARADVTLIDPELEWTVKVDQFQSASRNSPFDGWKLKGRAVRTIVGGKTVWKL